MLIGVDFDNTIVCYGWLFHELAVELGWIPETVGQGKTAVRDYLRRQGRERQWTELQGRVYGDAIRRAAPFPGAVEFFQRCRAAGAPLAIVSHKTKTPFAGPALDLHAAARQWIEEHLVDEDGRPLIAPHEVHLLEQRSDKLARIAELGCSHFVDDLPELLAAADFPARVVKILFQPDPASASAAKQAAGGGELLQAGSWSEVARLLGLPRREGPAEDHEQR